MSHDLRKVLEQVEAKYGLKLPRTVTTIDYDEDVGDLYIRFKNADTTEGEPTSDGKIIIHYDKKGKIVAVEITDINIDLTSFKLKYPAPFSVSPLLLFPWLCVCPCTCSRRT